MATLAWDALPLRRLADDLIAEILIRLPTLADLGRACAACPAFHRFITGSSFLRCLRALHSPSLLDFHTFSGGFQPVDPPHPYAPAAHALAATADFTFSFLPPLGSWMVRDGLFLLDCDEGRNGTFTTVAVCDPLFRRYVLVPPIPRDLTAVIRQPYLVNGLNGERRCDGENEEAAAGSSESFRVIWMAQCPTELIAFVFASAIRAWRAIASPCWRDLNPAMPSETERRSPPLPQQCIWLLLLVRRSKLIVLDMGRMEFSPVDLQAGYSIAEFAIVELVESKLGMFSSNCFEGSVLKLLCADMTNYGEVASGSYRVEPRCIPRISITC